MSSKAQKADHLIQINNLEIEGFSDEQWHPIIKGVNLTLKRGQVMGILDTEMPTIKSEYMLQKIQEKIL